MMGRVAIWKCRPRHNHWTVGVLLAIGLFGQPALCWPQAGLAQLTNGYLLLPYPGGRLGDESCAMVLAHVSLASHGPKPDSQAAPPPAEALQVSLSGWFTVIWNDTTHYFLTDDQGRWTELLLDEQMTKPFGGPLALNRKRVKILGVSVAAPPGAVRVLSIAFE